MEKLKAPRCWVKSSTLARLCVVAYICWAALVGASAVALVVDVPPVMARCMGGRDDSAGAY